MDPPQNNPDNPDNLAEHSSGGAPAPSQGVPPPLQEQERMVEAMLFASATPLSLAQMTARCPPGCDLAEVLRALQKHYDGRGVRLIRSEKGWAFRTAPELAHVMQSEKIEQRKLSRAATETLAIIAYHQPITRAEIEEIRGVSVHRGTLEQLMELSWIRFGRRRQTPGRPMTFLVTEEFLDHFGLETTRDLPGLDDLRAAGLLDNRSIPGRYAKTGDADADADDEDDDNDLYSQETEDLFDR